MYQYNTEAPALDDVEARSSLTLLNFGTDWCGHCQAALTPVSNFLQQHSHVTHITVEDGKGRPLGRHYKVNLWPRLILLKDGQEVARVVRPTTSSDLEPLSAEINA